MKTNQKGIDLIKYYEGIRDGDKTTPNYDAYICPAGYVTIGYGHVVRLNGKMLKGAGELPLAKQVYPNGLSLQYCEDLLAQDLEWYENKVSQLVKVKVNSNQFSALVSLAYNIGLGSFSGSTLLDKLNKGYYDIAAAEFLKWNKATIDGKLTVLKGLTARRNAEKKLFETPEKITPETIN